MNRQVREIQPTRLRRRDGGPAAELQSQLGTLGEVRAPSEAEEPILSPAVRGWLFSWLTEIRSGDELESVGLRARTTAVLHGPPGCGKTTLAHHLSARLGLSLVIVGPETILGKYLGESEGNVARLFRVLGSTETPCVLFIDELEAIGRKRSSAQDGGGAENARQNTLTVLLRKVEEFEGYLLGATNRPQDLDPALWRRFHMQLAIELPGPDERFAILKRYGLPFAFRDEDLDLLVDLTHGASPALLRGVMEGVKRSLVIYPKIGMAVDDVAALFAAILVAVQPPPEIQHPPLWSDGKAALAELGRMAWPPAREAGS